MIYTVSDSLKNVLTFRQAARTIKGSPALLDELMRLTSHCSEQITIVERVWLVKNDQYLPPSCEYGASKKWVDGNVGYRFCGIATKCKCARENHSKKIS